MMRVAYVSADPGVPVWGCKGCSVHVQEVIRALQRSGAEVELHTVRTGGAAPSDLSGVRVCEIPFNRKGKAAEIERRALNADGHVLASLESRPAYDIVYERYSLWSTAGMDFARKSGIAGVLEVNAPLVLEQAEHRTLVDRRLAQQIAGRVFRAASVIVAVSNEIAAYVRSLGADPDCVHVLPNGVDPVRFHPRTESPSSFEFTVGFVGSLKPWHDLMTLAAAYKILLQSHPKARLLVVGEGPERKRLEQVLSPLPDSGQVVFPGAVQPEDVPRWMREMDVGVAPYANDSARYFSPLKVLEYMAAGLPVLASRTGQIPSLVEDRHSGLLYPAEDAAALACGLANLADDPETRRRMGRAGRAAVLRRHTWEGVVASTLGFARLSGLRSEEDSR